MMYYDHAMLGIAVALAAGAHRRHGWPLVGTAAVAAMLPDWDGLSELIGPMTYRQIHRVWGHNLLAAALASGFLAAVGYLCQLSIRLRPGEARVYSGHALAVWVAVGVLVALSHVLADLIYAGTRVAPDWPVALLWPFSPRRWACSLVPEDDWGATLLLVGGMAALCL